MSNQINKLNVFISIKAFFFLITLFLGFFLVGCGGGSGGSSGGNVSNTTNAAVPTITVQPISATYTQGKTATALSVTATVSDGGTLSYQWYKNSANSNNGGTPISGETNSSYMPPISDIGTTYYYVVVTNTNNNVNGNKTANVISDTAQIAVDVIIITDAQIPTITVQPQDATYTQGDIATALNVTANVSDGGTLSYQWYKNSINSNNGGIPISGAISSNYTPSTSTIGITYYYVVVTNTNNNVNGIKTANASSDTAQIAIAYLVSFYDKNLDHVVTINATTSSINLPNVSNTSNPWYKANSSLPLTTDYNLIDDVRFYAIPNVQEIATQDELAAINTDATTLSGKYILLNDIDLDETGAGFDANGWLSIGNTSNRFTGIFNGDFNNITNLWINRTKTNGGFFGYIQNAQIRNLGIKTAKDKEITGGQNIGGIVGDANVSNIINSCFAGSIRSNRGGNVGGIVGEAIRSNITNSCFAGNVNGSNQVGGIAGYAQYGNIINSHSAGSIGVDYNFGGGIAGYIERSSIANSYSTINANGKSYIGGIAGQVTVSDIINSYSIGSINGTNSYIGGIAGSVLDGTVRNNTAINPSVTGVIDVNRVVGSTRSSINFKSSNNFALDVMIGGANYDGVTNSFSNSSDTMYHGTDKTKTELKTQSTYENDEASGGLGWKFGNDDDNPWKIDPNKNNGYPYLYWQDIR